MASTQRTGRGISVLDIRTSTSSCSPTDRRWCSMPTTFSPPGRTTEVEDICQTVPIDRGEVNNSSEVLAAGFSRLLCSAIDEEPTPGPHPHPSSNPRSLRYSPRTVFRRRRCHRLRNSIILLALHGGGSHRLLDSHLPRENRWGRGGSSYPPASLLFFFYLDDSS